MILNKSITGIAKAQKRKRQRDGAPLDPWLGGEGDTKQREAAAARNLFLSANIMTWHALAQRRSTSYERMLSTPLADLARTRPSFDTMADSPLPVISHSLPTRYAHTPATTTKQ